MHSNLEKNAAGTGKKACEKFILVGIENSVISMQENKMSFHLKTVMKLNVTY